MALTQEERDIELAIKLSMEMHAPPHKEVIEILDDPPAQPQQSFLSSRAQMEAERLARQRAREGHNPVEEPAHKRVRRQSPPQSVPNTNQYTSLPTATSKYWNGRLFTTRHSQIAPTYRDITFTQCLGPVNEMQSALLLTYASDPEWIKAHFPPNVKIVMGIQSDAGSYGKCLTTENLMLCSITIPERRRTMHVKIMILYYSTFLRVCISTGNLIDFDWGPTENAVYIQDFPMKGGQTLAGPSKTEPASSEFCDVLLDVLKSCDAVPENAYRNLASRYDFSKADGVKLVFSKWGTHDDDEEVKYGAWRYREAVKDLGLRKLSKEDVTMECQGSSMGFYNQPWLKQLHGAASGRSATTTDDIHSKISVLFPTHNTVANSILGTNGGSTMFCKANSWAGVNRRLFKKALSKKEGVLMHGKMILSLYKQGKDITRGHLYVGSHNFTASAWGREMKGKLDINNLELGVLIPLDSPILAFPGEVCRDGVVDLQRRADEVVLWRRPVVGYGTEQPWIQAEH